jgi:hypothetical protein
MPIGFVGGPSKGTAIPIGPDESNLLAYLQTQIQNTPRSSGDDLHVALEVNLSFKRTAVPGAAQVSISNAPNATPVTLSEEDVRKTYPWAYRDLCEKLKNRYVGFKANKKFHVIRKPLMGQTKYVKTRYLDPQNPKSTKKDFYNPNILQEFDKHYTRRR